ncbi:MAG TPA: gamma carbonic anhydrase family protein [Acetobacteraceae bacterium]|jgi:carbonic anhydrase/acetyltransferase-like protein (isoleucine patch superfamily)|nr:gamma carbonic anhydrase family protein [Acetobacteraceae bacterium]
MTTGPIYALDGVVPTIAADAFIAPNAAVIGDVMIGSESGVWFGCLVRGDMNIIRIGARTNVQDGTIIHVDFGALATHIGDDVTIGHGSIIHACTLRNRAFVGNGAIVLDGAIVEEDGFLGAGAVLTPGKVIKPFELWAGIPAKPIRVMSEEERRRYDRNSETYRQLAARFRAGLQPIAR